MSNPLDNRKSRYKDTLKYYKEMHLYLDEMMHINNITSDIGT